MRIERAKDELRWFIVDHNNKIARVFYSKAKALEYMRKNK